MPAGRKQVRLARKAEVNCGSIDRTGATTAYVLITIGRVHEIGNRASALCCKIRFRAAHLKTHALALACWDSTPYAASNAFAETVPVGCRYGRTDTYSRK